MLSDRFYNTAQMVIPAFSIVGILPCTWDQEKKVLSGAVPKWNPYLVKWHTAYNVVFLLVLLAQSVKCHLDGEFNLFNLLYSVAMAKMLLTMGFLLFSLETDDVRAFGNMLLLELRHINRAYLPHFNPNNSRRIKFVEAGIYGMLGGFLATHLICTAFITFPRSDGKVFLSSFLPSGKFSSFIVIPFRVYVSFNLFVLLMAGFSIAVFTFLIGVFLVPFLANEMRLDRRDGGYEAIPELRSPPALCIAYRSVQLVLQQMNLIVGRFLVPVHTIVLKLVVLSTYMLAHHGRSMRLPPLLMLILATTISSFCWTLVLLMNGYIYFIGKKILNSWKYHGWSSKREASLMSKFRRSCIPIAIRYGRTYVIRRLTVLKFVRGLSVGIFRVLLLGRK